MVTLPGGILKSAGVFSFALLVRVESHFQTWEWSPRQIVTKVMSSSFFDNLFDARSLTSDDLVLYTNMAMNAIKKFDEMNANNVEDN